MTTDDTTRRLRATRASDTVLRAQPAATDATALGLGPETGTPAQRMRRARQQLRTLQNKIAFSRRQLAETQARLNLLEEEVAQVRRVIGALDHG